MIREKNRHFLSRSYNQKIKPLASICGPRNSVMFQHVSGPDSQMLDREEKENERAIP